MRFLQLVWLSALIELLILVHGSTAKVGVPSYAWRTVVNSSDTVFGDPLTYCDGVTSECFVVVLVFEKADATTLMRFRGTDGHLLWATRLNFSLPEYNGWVAREPGKLFVGTLCGVNAFDEVSSELLWTYKLESCFHLPSHPTSGGGMVYFTVEDGVQSSNVYALRSSDGTRVFVTDDVAFTRIWISHHCRLIVYGAATVSSTSVTFVGIIARDMLTGAIAWKVGNVSYSQPGLNNNPNIDVDDAGVHVFVYVKLHIGMRSIWRIDACTGAVQWRLPTIGHVADYDTFAFKGDFFRLISLDNASALMALERFSGTAVNDTPIWSVRFPNSDTNSILVVGGFWAFSFGLDSRRIVATTLAGKLQWITDTLGSLYTGVVLTFSSNTEALIFGTADGILNAISL